MPMVPMVVVVGSFCPMLSLFVVIVQEEKRPGFLRGAWLSDIMLVIGYPRAFSRYGILCGLSVAEWSWSHSVSDYVILAL
jgi:hypothetical protein